MTKTEGPKATVFVCAPCTDVSLSTTSVISTQGHRNILVLDNKLPAHTKKTNCSSTFCWVNEQAKTQFSHVLGPCENMPLFLREWVRSKKR